MRSVRNKRDDLSSAIDSCSADIVILTETWLSSDIADYEILECERVFKFFRCDRISRSGGGVLIAVRDGLSCCVINIATHLEIVCTRVTLGYRDFIFCVCYRPPSSPLTFNSDLHDVINELIVRFPSCPLFLLGDFNFPTINWHDSPPSSDCSSECSLFINLCLDFNFKQLVLQPTRSTRHSANILDLLLTTTPQLVSCLRYLPGLSDHCLIYFELRTSAPATKAPKVIRDYKNADFESINRELMDFVTQFIPSVHTRSVDENWTLFKEKANFLIDQFIPQKRIISNSHAPWFNTRLRRLLNKKKRLFRRAKATQTAERWHAYATAKTDYKQISSEVKKKFLPAHAPVPS